MNQQVKFLDANAIVVSSEVQKAAEDQMNAAMKDAEPAAKEMRQAWIETRRAHLAEANDETDHEIDLILENALDNQVLSGNFEIEVWCPDTKKFKVLFVTEILSDKEAFNGALTLDPIEPEYDGRRLVGKLYLDQNKPVLFSQARGGSTYELAGDAAQKLKARAFVEYAADKNDVFIDACVDALAASGEFFRSGSNVVHLRNGEASTVNEYRLSYELSKLAVAFQHKETKHGTERVNIAFTKSMLCQILEVAGERLQLLNGCADYPLVLPNGALLKDPGYDEASGLFVLNGTSRFPRIYQKPTVEQLREAVETCLRPFRRYKFDDEFNGRTASLFAMMVSVLRPSLSVAPMVVTTSNKTGVGKGYFQQALAVVRTGQIPDFRNIERSNPSEFRKVLFAMLYEGKSIIALDNIDGPLKNETLSSFITAPVWSDRVLGQTKTGGSLRNDALLLLNGCRVDLGKNIVRKVLRIGLTEAREDHRFHDFGFLPHKEALKYRKEIISAVLTIACHAKHCLPAVGTIGSFEEVNELIRKPIADIALRCPDLRLIDPLGLFKDLVDNDIDTADETDILSFIREEMGDDEFDARDLRLKIVNSYSLEMAFKELTAVSPTFSSHSIGAILNQLRDEERGGLILRGRKVGGKNRWQILEVG